MPALHPNLRNTLEKTVVKARDEAEAAARAALERLAVDGPKPFEHLDDQQRLMRNRLRAHARQVGDKPRKNKSHEITHLVGECAYEHWHRMLFARFLAENSLLMHPEGVAVTLEECDELAAEEGTDRWTLAAEYASRMLPQIFRPDDPLLQVTLAPEDKRTLERLVADLSVDIFTADDSLGWCYQFWQTKRKEEVNKSEVDIGADELPAVTQLFTEDYMVRFLLHNSLGAWWTGKRSPVGTTEDELRKALSDTLEDYEFDYLRFIEDDGTWKPASGTFDGWPGKAAELKILDPCCGSGHFLVAVFELMARIRMAEEELSRTEAADAVIRDNLFGLELDQRCTQLAAFSTAMAAWRFGGGYRQLPQMNIACSGLAPNTPKEKWLELAGDNDGLLLNSLGTLYDLFQDAPTLGSLIDPARSIDQTALLEASFDKLVPLLNEALSRGNGDHDRREMGIVAQGIADAARLLAEKYHLVITNVPYRRGSQLVPSLRDYTERSHEIASENLATVFLQRMRRLISLNGSIACVTLSTWMYLKSYKSLRHELLEETAFQFVADLGPGAFETISGEVVDVILLTLSEATRIETPEAEFFGVDVRKRTSAAEKAQGLQVQQTRILGQEDQLTNPDHRIILGDVVRGSLLETQATPFVGLQNGDTPRFVLSYWELDRHQPIWDYFQLTPDASHIYSGMTGVLRWERGEGELSRFEGAFIKGISAWGNAGVAIRQNFPFPCSLFGGWKYDQSNTVIIPLEPSLRAPIWAYCTSDRFRANIRKLDKKRNVTTATFGKVPFDLEHWQAVAEETYPDGLPKPYSDDPTQWIFHGRPERATDPLQVAVARMLGYRWPAELDEEMELSDEARALVKRCDELLDLVDDDGIVGIPPVRGELPAADRVRKMLARAYGDDWSPAKEGELLAKSGFTNKTLDQWLRDGFFKQHCKLFQNRPFIWHIWDGHKNGFQALVNYHRLADGERGYKLLETLAFTYLGDWIRQLETAQGSDGTAETRLVHARALQENLHRILDGQSPQDIFVRWKPLEEQPIGWRPDLNDGVRMNIRPFMTVEQPGGRKGAGVLREKPNIKWTKDRGKDVESAPWYHLGPQYDGNPGDRINDHHLTLEEKKKAGGIDV